MMWIIIGFAALSVTGMIAAAVSGTGSGHRDNRHPLDPDPLDDTLHADVGDLKAGDVDEGESP